jgi:hypothetical protein
MLLQIFAAKFTMREWGREREREEWEKNGQHKLALRIDHEKRRGGLSFKGERQGRTPLHVLQVASMQEGALFKGGAPHEGGAHFRKEGKCSRNWEPPL